MKHALLICLCVLGLTVFANGANAATARPVVVELFTSQGCSSCPPADAYLRDLAERPDLLPLSFHVTYWDNLGWKDTLGNPAFTARQKSYSATMGLHGVYTPQIVIDGASEGIGSSRGDIDAKIAARMKTAPAIPLDVARKAESLTLKIGEGAKPASPATLWLVRYAKAEPVAIARGENRGTTVVYVNVVREMRAIGVWNGAAMEVALPKLNGGNYVALLQIAGTGPIWGAARIEP